VLLHAGKFRIGDQSMRICLVGAVESSEVAFNALVQSGCPPTLVVSLPTEAARRHSDFVDLTTAALERGIPVHDTTNINAPEALNTISASQPDLTLVIGWSQICRKAFRDIARIGTLGFHPSPLPRMRGRGVIPWTILRNEATSGSTLFWLDEGVDSGDMLLQRHFSLDLEETARSLYDKHVKNLREMVPEAIALVGERNPPRTAQNEDDASYCARRRPEDGLIDWRWSAASILRLIRAVGDPYPGSFTHYAGEKFRIDEAIAFPHSGRYVGLPGQVQALHGEGFIVMCGDNECIEVKKWQTGPGKRPRVHEKLEYATFNITSSP
jgi:methionyl-tRNA formyltransferase